MNQFIESKKEEFNKAVDFFKKEISSLRTGRANPNMLEGVTVDAYGAKTPLNGVASISVPDGQSIIIAPWDKGILKEIEKAMVEADLGVGVVNEGEKNKEIPEDDKFRYMKELDELMAGKNDEIKSVRDKKEKDIMTI